MLPQLLYCSQSKPFYKPQIPQDEITNGGAGLIIGDKIVYSCDWRELIYRMAIDYKNYADKDPTTDPEKMEDDVNRDNFLMKVREWNPSFYPDGYTGYEQYYTDMEGFWRQLYDPDYTTSYDIISLSKRKYTEEGRLGEFYYDAPIYTQCQSDDPYYSGVLYYVLKSIYIKCSAPNTSYHVFSLICTIFESFF